jgi:hypothetical protein
VKFTPISDKVSDKAQQGRTRREKQLKHKTNNNSVFFANGFNTCTNTL